VKRNRRVWIASSSEKEREGMDVHLEFEGSNSNGLRKEMDKEGNMMKIVEKLQKDAQTHRTDSRNLRKIWDKQGEFNLKLLKSLERIEKKLEKEGDSRRTGSCWSPVLILFLPILYHKDLYFHTQYHFLLALL
jgi:hypothetical protein